MGVAVDSLIVAVFLNLDPLYKLSMSLIWANCYGWCLSQFPTTRQRQPARRKQWSCCKKIVAPIENDPRRTLVFVFHVIKKRWVIRETYFQKENRCSSLAFSPSLEKMHEPKIYHGCEWDRSHCCVLTPEAPSKLCYSLTWIQHDPARSCCFGFVDRIYRYHLESLHFFPSLT